MEITAISLEEVEAQRSKVHIVIQSHGILMERLKTGPVETTENSQRGFLEGGGTAKSFSLPHQGIRGELIKCLTKYS